MVVGSRSGHCVVGSGGSRTFETKAQEEPVKTACPNTGVAAKPSIW